MKAAVFHKAGDIWYEQFDDPKIKDACDAIIRAISTAICGSDLHIYDGFLPQLRPEVFGHEFMGIVEEVGSGVNNLSRNAQGIAPTRAQSQTGRVVASATDTCASRKLTHPERQFYFSE